MTVVRPSDSLRITAKALADQTWRADPSITVVGLGILTWLRDEAAPMQEILVSSDEPAQEILDTAGMLVDRGLIEVVNDEPTQCDLAAGVHVDPHVGCILR